MDYGFYIHDTSLQRITIVFTRVFTYNFLENSFCWMNWRVQNDVYNFGAARLNGDFRESATRPCPAIFSKKCQMLLIPSFELQSRYLRLYHGRKLQYGVGTAFFTYVMISLLNAARELLFLIFSGRALYLLAMSVVKKWSLFTYLFL